MESQSCSIERVHLGIQNIFLCTMAQDIMIEVLFTNTSATSFLDDRMCVHGQTHGVLSGDLNDGILGTP